MFKGTVFFLKSFAVIFFITVFFVSLTASEFFKVGIYQNDPKVLIDDNGNPAGIFVDVLNEIANVNGWKIEYVKGNWNDHIEKLKNNEIDILVDVAFSKERAEIFQFNKIEVIGSWVQAFSLNNSKIQKFKDLAGKKIGVLAGSVQESYFNEELKRLLEIDFQTVSFQDYEKSVKSLLSGEVDAIFATRFFYFSSLRDNKIKPTPIIFGSEGLFFAFSRTVGQDVLIKFDDALTKMKNDPDSVYYKSLYKWLGIKSESIVPDYIFWSLIAVLALLAFFIVFSFLLKNEVKRKTAQAMAERNKYLETVMKTQKLESIGILAGGIAHDFNNLLTGIFGFVDLARNSCGNNIKCSEYIEFAMKSLDRAKALTYQLLTFSKGGVPVIKSEKIDNLINDVARFALSGSNCSVVFSIDSNLSRVKIDKNQISQVIENLVINAHQSMPDGGEIKISAKNYLIIKGGHPLLRDGKYVKVSVCDNGTGIDPELTAKIFDPFFTTKKKGSGLGLATSYSIIRKHDGFIDVESILGKGSVFNIYLPADECETTIEKEEFTDDSLHSGRGNVLIMDDEMIVRDLMSEMLMNMGYEVFCSENGADAIDLFMKTPDGFEFLIFDLTVSGGMGGIETVKKIREVNEIIPIFVASGYAGDPVMSNPQIYGFSGSISKPFKMAEISNLLKKNVRTKKGEK